MHPNPYRGEIVAELGGARRRLRLTLGALAELEAALEAESLAELFARFEQGRFTARELIAIIGAGLRGAGNDISDEEVARLASGQGVPGYVDIAARLLAAAFPEQADDA